MKLSKRIFTYALVAMLWIILLIGLLTGNLIGTEGSASSESVPPKYFSLKERCGPGCGLPLGESQIVQGKVIIIRTTLSYGCWANKGLPLFDKDTISTQENGRMRFSFNDGSLVTLSHMTELEIIRSVYDQAARERSLFLNMRSGKARFIVRKLDDFRYSEVKIKTQTALVIVVGSDFIIEADNTSTRITALKDTSLEVMSLANMEAGSTVVSDFQWTIVKENAIPSEVGTISQEEVGNMLNGFTFVEVEQHGLDEPVIIDVPTSPPVPPEPIILPPSPVPLEPDDILPPFPVPKPPEPDYILPPFPDPPEPDYILPQFPDPPGG